MYDVTWGQGGPEQTVRCVTIERAREAADMTRAWGAIVKPFGQCPWQVQARARNEDDAPRYTY